MAGGGWRWGLPALLLLAPFLWWPLGAMLWRGIAPDGAPSSEALRAVLTDGFYWGRLGFTLGQALASTALALLVGFPAAYVFALIRFPGRGLLLAVVTVPFVLPTLVVALAFQQLLGPGGWFNDALGLAGLGPVQPVGTIWAILAAHVFYNVSIVVRIVSGVWANLDPRAEEAARLLGAGRWRTFTAVVLPALAPALLSAGALVFTFTFTSFGVVLVLGGPGLDTLEVTIYRLATRLVNLPEAAILGFVQLAATLAALVVYATLQRRLGTRLGLRPDRARPLGTTSRPERALLVAVLLGLALLIVAPIAALVHGALTVGASAAVTGRHFTAIFEDTGRLSFVAPLDAIRWSLTFAVGAMAIAMLVGAAAAMAIAHTRGGIATVVDGLLMLPLAVPAVVLGFGYLVTFNRGWYDLRGSPWLVLAAHALIGYPFVLRAVLAVLRSLDPSLPDAARVLGASPWRVWRAVELPITARATLVGAIFAFAVSLGEFGATSLLRRREFATVPIAIFDALGRPGPANLGKALALSTILMAVTALAFLLIERVRFREVREF
ncbi:MAG: iron ABC transporter permease [Chloroflexi bacterium]|nr:iron ABC transporter permease [Chloroflexota bacterium]